MEKLMVTLDGSELSELAIPLSRGLARATGAEVVLFRAAVAQVVPGLDPSYMQVQVVAEAQQYLEAWEDRLRSAGFNVTSVVSYGPAAEQIVDMAEFLGVDLIVMCTHGRSGLGRWVYGSVADKVLRASSVPVLLVRARDYHPQGDEVVPSRILVPLDGSKLAEAILPYVADLSGRLEATVVLFQVLQPVEEALVEEGRVVAYVDELMAQKSAAARRYLEDVAGRLAADGLQTEIKVAFGNAPEEIIQNAHQLGIDMIAMSTHGRSGVSRWVYGSVADRVLRGSGLPVLLFRPKGLLEHVVPPLFAAV
jgi:nucleotide-binding universal stress UspA family protein